MGCVVLRIAILTTSYPAFAGDACGHFVETEARLFARRAEVFVVTADHRHEEVPAGRRPSGAEVSSVPPSAVLDSLSVVRLAGHGAFGWPGASSNVRARPPLLLGAARWAVAARRALRSLAPLDRVVAHWAVPCGWPIASDLDAPLELVSHGADVRLLTALPGLLRRAVVRRLLRRTEAWRFVSRPLIERLSGSLDTTLARRLEAIARVEPCPIEVPDVRDAALENRALCRGAPLAVCVGRLVASKAVERVIDFVATRLAPGTRLVIVGDGPLRANLEGHARSRGVDALFLGQATRRTALAWIGAADLVLHASLAEGLSTVEREARALGVPFVFVDGSPSSSDAERGPVPLPFDLR
jgi:teichuronic acid biosynthesis glycosyltransferase TuaC